MKNSPLGEISIKYKDWGIKKGVEFLMSPDKMTSLIDDLAGQGVLIAGCDLWRYADREKGWIVQLVGAGFDIGDAPSSVHEAAEKVKRFILEDLPADAELVSLIYFDRSVYEAFK